MEVPIQVVARLRPKTEGDEEGKLIEAAPLTSQVILGSNNIFDFDAIFTSECSQKEIFATCIAENILPKFFQGVNSSVLTYGQHASGKTYTMVGPEILWAMNEEEFGILPQAIRHIFQMMNDSPNKEYRVHVSYLMVNRDSVYDLLLSGRPISSLNVFDDAMGNVVVPGLTVVDCIDIEQVLNCLKAGLLQTHSASGQGFDILHAHTIFSLTLEQQWIEPDGILKYVYSRISFIDLAGSDNVKSSNFNGGMRRLLPSSDLAVLRNVIQSRAVGASHIPCENSRLTHVIKDAFGGNSLTLMICCLSMTSRDYEATYETLKVCSAARSIVNRLTLQLVLHNNCPSNSIISSNNNNQNTASRSSSQTTLNQQYVQNNGYPTQDHLQPNIYAPPAVPALHDNFAQRNSIPDVARDSDEVFRFQFAASQWHQLVSSAENLLAEILQAEGISATDKSKIQSWLCMKAEADDCIGKDIAALPQPTETIRQLDVIEELSEPNDGTGSSSVSCASESDLSNDSSLEDEFYEQLHGLECKFNSQVSDLVDKCQKEIDSLDRLQVIFDERARMAPPKKTDTIEIQNISIDSPKDQQSTDHMSHDSSCVGIDLVTQKDYQLCDNLTSNCGSREHLLANEPAKRDGDSLIDNGRAIVDKKVANSVESFDEPYFGNDSSDNELIRKVSSKLLSVSKGPSKCVDSIKSKSSLLKKSIKSHIFGKKKLGKSPENILLNSLCEKGDQNCQKIGFNLKATEHRLKELNAIIKLKERFLLDLRKNRSENAIKKCEQIRSQLEAELQKITETYHIAQGELLKVSGETDRMSCRKRVDNLKRDVSRLKKHIRRMPKVIAIAQNTQTIITELEESLRELQTQQEEAQTKIREEMQRKQQLEQIVNSRGIRNPLCNSNLLHDEYPEEKKEVSSQIFATGFDQMDFLASQTKKRKFTNSPACLQEKSVSVNASNPDICAGEDVNIRTQIGNLRDSKLLLVYKRQKLDKKLRKNSFNEADEERRLLELDEAVEGLDLVMERLNLCLSGAAPNLEESASLLRRYDLIQNLKDLSVNELTHLLVKYFNKVIDIRIEFRKQEIDYRDLETKHDEQSKYIRDITEACRQASLEMEHRHTLMRSNYEEKISLLLRQLDDGSAGRVSGGDSRTRIWKLEEKLFYYKELSRKLTENLRKYSSSVPTRPTEALPGPSRLRNHRQSDASADPHQIRRERRFAIQDGGSRSNQITATKEKHKVIIEQNYRTPKASIDER